MFGQPKAKTKSTFVNQFKLAPKQTTFNSNQHLTANNMCLGRWEIQGIQTNVNRSVMGLYWNIGANVMAFVLRLSYRNFVFEVG